MSGTRRVNWSDSPPTGGSRGDHRRNDSGVGGPFSDTEDRSPKQSSDYNDPYTTIPRLQDAYIKVTEQKEKYKKKAEELDLDLIRVKAELAQVKKDLKEKDKDLKEKEAQWRALVAQNEVLESDNKTLNKENKKLLDEVADFEDKPKRANRKSSSPPTSMTGAIHAESTSDDKTPRRSSSQRKSGERRGSVTISRKDLERQFRHQQREEEERQEREREDRLRRRMGNSPGDESDANASKSSSGSRKSNSSRHSYIEPMGEATPRPAPQVPQSPRGAQYSSYATQQYGQPTYTPMRTEPVVGNVSRSIRPQVLYSSDQYPTGVYQDYPLPLRRN